MFVSLCLLSALCARLRALTEYVSKSRNCTAILEPPYMVLYKPQFYGDIHNGLYLQGDVLWQHMTSFASQSYTIYSYMTNFIISYTSTLRK